MVTLFIRHDVADYDAWRAGFDGAAEMQKAGGVRALAVYQSVEDPNDITVTHDFDSLESAQAFAGSPELHAALESLGTSNMQVWFTNPA